MTDSHWIRVDQELAKLVVLATVPPIKPDFDFTISYKNVWDNGNFDGIFQLVNE